MLPFHNILWPLPHAWIDCVSGPPCANYYTKKETIVNVPFQLISNTSGGEKLKF